MMMLNYSRPHIVWFLQLPGNSRGLLLTLPVLDALADLGHEQCVSLLEFLDAALQTEESEFVGLLSGKLGRAAGRFLDHDGESRAGGGGRCGLLAGGARLLLTEGVLGDGMRGMATTFTG
eukprot:CAMPEP_0174895324 /NCGR_PEP_ID=MMETSP0167-20121228/9757_1 /TAXON_ID=38298 /ORGANISM="Rhodella maculata, Strain CCMP736" /LENGTH=119 /DNA_ID=CAMNT_0016134627 /DNA_START=264 /DNA_END=621 /DNA_ORIENTATION=+